MTSDQRKKLAQGLTFGLFFFLVGNFMKFTVQKHSVSYHGGDVAIFMGFVIFAWGWLQLAMAQALPRWVRPVALASFVGIGIFWFG